MVEAFCFVLEGLLLIFGLLTRYQARLLAWIDRQIGRHLR
jgi:hypothetical protein